MIPSTKTGVTDNKTAQLAQQVRDRETAQLHRACLESLKKTDPETWEHIMRRDRWDSFFAKYGSDSSSDSDDEDTEYAPVAAAPAAVPAAAPAAVPAVVPAAVPAAVP